MEPASHPSKIADFARPEMPCRPYLHSLDFRLLAGFLLAMARCVRSPYLVLAGYANWRMLVAVHTAQAQDSQPTRCLNREGPF